jgi:hypothetical protein
VVNDGFRESQGIPLRAGAGRRYEVGEDERRRVGPGGWVLAVPSSRTCEPLVVAFDRPLDHGLLGRCLHVVGPDGRLVHGMPEVGPEERSWRLVPGEAWAPGAH